MRHVLWALGALVLLGFAALLGVNWYVSAAYRFADGFPRTDVSAWDQMGKLGTAAPAFTGLGLLLVGAVALIATGMLLIGWRTRPYAWLAPIGAIVLVAAVVGIGTTMFEPPPPDLGG